MPDLLRFPQILSRRLFIGAGFAAIAACSSEGRSTVAQGNVAQPSRPATVVHRDPNCGCCIAWADHLRAAGFPVSLVETTDMASVKQRLGVPAALASCHTGEIAGYVIEGHVPAADIARLLASAPADIRGLAVPGMPMGSPGMESPSGRRQAFDVIAFGPTGRTMRFNAYAAT